MEKIVNKWGEKPKPTLVENNKSWHTMIGRNPTKNCNYDESYKIKYLLLTIPLWL